MPKIITISGKARNGKDTFANMLSNYFSISDKKAYIYHYADPLKMCATNYYNWNGEKDEKGRSLLQWLGTEKVRANNPDAWIQIAREIICGTLFDADYVIIPDARFPNEIEFWGDDLLTSIHVRRGAYLSTLTEEQQMHESETALDDYCFEFEVEAENLVQLAEAATVVGAAILDKENN
jgi:hypothetical protein